MYNRQHTQRGVLAIVFVSSCALGGGCIVENPRGRHAERIGLAYHGDDESCVV